MKIDLIVDLQYGSTGKGLLAGYLAETSKHDGVITCNMPNAGHTYIDSKGNKMIHKVLPSGIVSPNLRSVFIGPGAVFDPKRLEIEVIEAKKMGYLDEVPIFIHGNAMVLRDDHRHAEQMNMSKISSTMQGSAIASMEKMARNVEDICIAHSVYTPGGYKGIYVVDNDTWIYHVSQINNMLAEGSQGFSLGINQRFYPYCTSRECTPHRMMSDMGLPCIKAEVWGTLRTYPIRVGNTEDGHSGDHYSDQREITWGDLGQTPELTTVTQRVRRIFTFSKKQLSESLWHCRPDHLFLNFCNYMDPTSLGALTDNIDRIAAIYGTGIRLTGVGATFHDVRQFNSKG
jgi:adenylosuccinate synthase